MAVTTGVRLAAAASAAALLGATGVLLAPLSLRLVKADPSYYLSYILDYRDVSERFGQTYHGNRISYILFDTAFFSAFGPEWGYLTARWVLLSLAAFAVLIMAARRAGPLPALATSAAIALTPWLPRQLLWTHYDGVATVYLLLAVLLLTSERRSTPRMLLAGSLLGLFINANLAYGIIVISGLGAWVVTAFGSRQERLRQLLGIGAGIVLSELLLSVALRVLVGEGPLLAEWIAIRTALFLAQESQSVEPMLQSLRQSPLLTLLPALGAASFIAGVRAREVRDRWLALFGGMWLLAASTAVLALHFVMDSAWIESPFYMVTFLPPSVVAAVGLLAVSRSTVDGAPVRAGPLRASAPAVLLLSAWMLLLVILWVRGEVQYFTFPISLLSIGLLVWITLRGRSHPVRAVAVLVPLVFLSAWAGTAQVPDSREFSSLSEREVNEWTLFDAIVDIKALIAEEVPTSRDLVFWHRVEGPEGDRLRQINMAYYGGGTGRLHIDKGPGRSGMPALSPAQVASLLERRPVSVVLLGLDPREMTAGIVSIATAVPNARTSVNRTVEGVAFDVHVAVVEID